ncbi:MAG: murein biosynthesis integral membrane protein MurJ, partial [Actinomycetes bacterium]
MTAPADESQSSESTANLPPWATAALLIAVVTLIARVLGLIRFAVLSRTVGTGCLGDIYATANAVPNIVYEVVVGGAFVALVVPLVAGVGEKEPGKVRATVAALHGWALVLLVPITVLMYVASTLVIDVLLGAASGCPSNSSSVATDMLWVFLLQIPIYGATVVAQGSLQAHHRFFAPAVAPAVSSLVVIASYFVYDAMAGAHQGSLGELTTAEFWVLAGGTTLGVVALLLVQLPALARAKLIVKPSLTFPDGRARHAWTLAWSGGVVVASQWVAYAAAIRWSNVYGDQGSALVFVISWTLFLVPWAILALPIATSTFPRLSVLHARHDRVGAATITASSLRTVVVASAAGAAGVAAAAQPLAIVLVQGSPGSDDAVPQLAAILLALAPGVLAYGVHGHLVRVLAAGHHAPMAAAATVVGWVVGLAVAWAAVRSADDTIQVARGIGLGFSAGLIVAALILVAVVAKVDGRAALHRVPVVTLVAGAVALAVAGLGYLVLHGEEASVTLALLQTLVVGLISCFVVGSSAL